MDSFILLLHFLFLISSHVLLLCVQDFLPRTSVAYQVRTNVPPSFTSVPSSEMSTALWPRQDDSLVRLNRNDFGISTPLVADANLSGLSACFQPDISPAENLVLERHWCCLLISV